MNNGIGRNEVKRSKCCASAHYLHKGKARTVFTVRAFLVLAYLLIDAAVATLKGAGR